MIHTQTIIVAVCLIVVFLFMLANVFVSSGPVFQKSKLVDLLIVFIIVLPSFFFNTYAVNCMLEGNCDVFVWCLVGLAIIVTAIYILLSVRRMIDAKRNLKEK